MKAKKWIATVGALTMTAGLLAGCGENNSATTATGKETPKPEVVDNTPLDVTMAIEQVGEIPVKGNAIEQAIEKYTNSKLSIQWIPAATYEEKLNVMIASGELPKIVKSKYVPSIIGAIQNGNFWDITPYLKDYKNLSAQNAQYYENIKVDGKLYGIPTFREIGRSAISYRKDWFDALNLKIPKTYDDWYNVAKAIVQNDPDKNGKADTWAFMLFKKFNEGEASILTRIAVTQGGVNRWGVDSAGKLTPEHLTPQFVDTLKLFRKLYADKLINQDFPAFDPAEMDKMMDNSRVAMKLNGVATNATGIQDRVSKVDKNAVMDAAFYEGPQGPKVTGGSGNNGFLLFPKSSVKTEAELKRLLTFMDKLFDEPMAVLQKRGFENTHFKKNADGTVEWLDFTAFNKDVKPYRDNLLNFETYNVPQLKDTPIGTKGTKMEPEGLKYAVHNPALTLTSATLSERGKELDQMIWDAEVNYIVGKLDDAGWAAAVDKWKKSGGDQMIKELEASYAKTAKK